MKNILDKFTQKKFTKIESEEFLYSFKHLLTTGLDMHSALTVYLETSLITNKVVKKILAEIIYNIEKKGAVAMPSLFLKYGIFVSNFEKTLYDKLNDKSEAISIIIENRTKNKSITTNYFDYLLFHLLSALMIFSVYLFEKQYISSIIAMSNFIQIGKVKTIFIQPDWWIPSAWGIVGFIYIAICLYYMFIVYFGKYTFQKEFLRIQKHEETNILFSFMKMLRDQAETGSPLIDCLNGVKNDVDPILKKSISSIINRLKTGRVDFETNLKKEGFSKESCAAIKLLQNGGNYTETISIIMGILESRREGIKINVIRTQMFLAKASFWFVLTVISYLLSLEYMLAFGGLNVK